MKKTIIINIGNTIIHIEEDAYEILTAYLNEIKQHFAKNADDFEIVTDIENRIAEMFAEILEAGKRQVIEITDVQSVIAQMGSVKDFIGDEEVEDADPFVQQPSYLGAKKLYRDTDDGVIAGVCAGLGHYLNIEARWVRLIAFLTIFLGGAGFLAYIILWISMPRAVTRSEKMEMKGEATNLYGYQKNFEDELAAFKQKMKNAGDHFQPMAKRSGNFITEIIEALGRLLGTTGKLILKFIAGAFILCGFATLVCLIVCLAAFLGFLDANTFEVWPLSVINEELRNGIVLAAFVTLFIPVLALVLFAIRVAFNKKAINKSLSFGLLVIWLIGVAYSVYYTAKITSEFKEHAELVKTDDLKTFETYVIDVDKSVAFSKADSAALEIVNGNLDGRVVYDDSNEHPFRVPRNVRFVIEKSENNKTTITQNYESQGRTFAIALRNAQNIKYKYKQTDSLLILNPRLELKEESIWRNQEVTVTLKVPVGTRIKAKTDLYEYLYFNNFFCDDYNKTEDSYREWQMTEDGLKCKAELDKLKEEAKP